MNDLKKNVAAAPFKKFDLIILAALVVSVAAAFLFTGKVSGEKFEVLVGSDKVLEYDLSDGTYLIYDDRVTYLGNDVFLIKAGGGTNELTVDRVNKDAYVSFADCAGKQCTKMRLSSGSIICAPHDLTVRFVDGVSAPVVG